MANNCWNYIVFSGDENKLKEMFNEINEDDYDELNKNELDLPRWFEMEIDKDGFIISGDSAWNPPLNYTKLLCEKYKVYAEHEYAESGNGFAGYYDCDPDGNDSDRQLDYRDYIFEQGFDVWWHEYVENCELFYFLENNDDNDYLFHYDMTLEQVLEIHFLLLLGEGTNLKIYL